MKRKDPIERILEGESPDKVADRLLESYYDDEDYDRDDYEYMMYSRQRSTGTYSDRVTATCPICGDQAEFIYSVEARTRDYPGSADLDFKRGCEHYVGLQDEGTFDFWAKVNNPSLKKSVEDLGFDSKKLGNLNEVFGDELFPYEPLSGHEDYEDLAYFADIDNLKVMKEVPGIEEKRKLHSNKKLIEADEVIHLYPGKLYTAKCPIDPSDEGVTYKVDVKDGPLIPVKKCKHWYSDGDCDSKELAKRFWAAVDNPELKEYLDRKKDVEVNYWSDILEDDLIGPFLEYIETYDEDGNPIYVDAHFADFDKLSELHPMSPETNGKVR